MSDLTAENLRLRAALEPLFARRARLWGWDYWGDESLGTAEMPEAV